MCRVRRLCLHVAFFHAAIAPPHKEQPEQREEGRGKDIPELVVPIDQVHHRNKPHGTEQQTQRRAALSPCSKRGALVRVFGDRGHHGAVGTVHHAEEQAIQHEQHRGHHRLAGHLKRRTDKVGDS
ncbi:hypothetical protein D3C80_1417570 [compost metagenome]